SRPPRAAPTARTRAGPRVRCRPERGRPGALARRPDPAGPSGRPLRRRGWRLLVVQQHHLERELGLQARAHRAVLVGGQVDQPLRLLAGQAGHVQHVAGLDPRERRGDVVDALAHQLDRVAPHLQAALGQHVAHVHGRAGTHRVEDQLHGAHAGARDLLVVDHHALSVRGLAHEAEAPEAVEGGGKRLGHGASLPLASGRRLARENHLGSALQPDRYATWDKRAWRAWAREARRAAREASGAAADTAVARHVVDWERFRTARAVGVYLAFGAEVDLAPVIAAARAAGKLVAAPRVGRHGVLTLHQLRAGEAPERHRFGQPEPPAAAPEVPPEELDVVLVPGLVFDEGGHRLGYG